MEFESWMLILIILALDSTIVVRQPVVDSYGGIITRDAKIESQCLNIFCAPHVQICCVE